jgi:hypothetical protein
MALLTAQEITREAQSILHEKCDFLSTINRQYDNSFAQKGAKKGTQLKIRLPNEYVTRDGAAYQAQGHDEQAEILVVATQKGVDSEITSLDLTMSMDDFRTRVLEPQMAVLASQIEYDALSMMLDVADCVGAPGTVPGSTANQALLPWLQAKQRLDENLAPGPYFAQIDGGAASATLNGLSSLFNPQGTLSKQFTEGFLLRNSNIDYYQNNRVRRITIGTYTTAQAGSVNGANQGEDGSVIVQGMGNGLTIPKGAIVTLGCNAVHPETKQSYGRAKQFVVTAAFTSAADGSGTLYIAPNVITSGAKQNVDAAVITGATVTMSGTPTASTSYVFDMVYARDAFAFVAADLEMPKGVDMAYQANQDGFPLRFIRWFDGDTDLWKSRFDVLYGYKTLRRQLACRLWGV